jgi:hypothetical protein
MKWAASSDNLKIKRPAPKGPAKYCVEPLSVPEVKFIPSLSTINSTTTATVLPRSPAWYNLTKGDSIASKRFDERAVAYTCVPACRSSRLPTSPLARFIPLSVDDPEHDGKEELEYFDRSLGSSHGRNGDLDMSTESL